MDPFALIEDYLSDNENGGHQSNASTGLMATFSDHADPSFIPLTLHN